jgi:hypothetical protein
MVPSRGRAMNTRKLVVPMAKRHWPRPALRFDGEGPFSVAGIVHRKADAWRFSEGALLCPLLEALCLVGQTLLKGGRVRILILVFMGRSSHVLDLNN